MRLFFVFLFLSVALVPLHTQIATIFELWDIAENACVLDSTFIQQPEQDYAVEAPPPPPPPSRKFSTDGNALSQMSSRFSYLTNKFPELSIPTIKWRENLQFIQKGGLWGLVSEKGEIIIKPSFDMVMVDTALTGFVAYNDGQCNYYNKAGKALLNSAYYHIQPTSFNTYIVRTKDGYGILDKAGSVVLPANNKSVKLLTKGEIHYFLIVTNQYNYLLSADGKRRINYSTNKYDWQLLDERYAYVKSKGVLIDLVENKQLFCGQDAFVKIINWEEKLLSIYLNRQKEVSYIIHLDGSLVSKDPWQKVGSYYPEGYIVVGRPAPLKPNKRASSVFGLIDLSGQIVLPVEYYRLGQKMLDGKYISLTDASYKKTLIDLKGERLFDYKSYSSITLSDDNKMINLDWKEGDERKRSQYDIATGKMEMIKPLKYWNLRPHNCNGETVFIAKTTNGEVLLNAKREPLIKTIPSRVFKGPEPSTFLTYRSNYSEGKRYVNRRWVNCSGDSHVFRLGGEKVDSFYALIKLRDDFFFVKTSEKEGYFSRAKKSTSASDYGWSEKTANIGSDFILKTGGFSSTGWVDENGELVALPEYRSIWLDRRIGLLSISKNEENKFYLKPDGSLLFDGAYPWVNHLGMGLFLFKKEKKLGLLNIAGEVLLAPEFTYLRIEKGMIFTKQTKKSEAQYYDLKGRQVY